MRTVRRGITASRRLPAIARMVPARPMALLALVVGVLALAACGNVNSSGQQHFNTPPATSATSPTAGAQSSYAYLYSRIDYPLQIPVNGSDTVSLILSPFSSVLTVAPTAGTGATTFSEPIPLPTDVQNYQDIGASVDTIQPSGQAPLAWQLTSAPRQSLLEPPGSVSRTYRNSVTFTWDVRAISAGENTTQIEMTIYYVWLDGSEHDGTLQVSQSPIPIVSVAVSAVRKTLPPLRLPIAGLTGLAGVLAFLRFFWGAYRTVKDATDTGRDAAKVARTIRQSVGQGHGDAQARGPMAETQHNAPHARVITAEPAPPSSATIEQRDDQSRLWPPHHSR